MCKVIMLLFVHQLRGKPLPTMPLAAVPPAMDTPRLTTIHLWTVAWVQLGLTSGLFLREPARTPTIETVRKQGAPKRVERNWSWSGSCCRALQPFLGCIKQNVHNFVQILVHNLRQVCTMPPSRAPPFRNFWFAQERDTSKFWRFVLCCSPPEGGLDRGGRVCGRMSVVSRGLWQSSEHLTRATAFIKGLWEQHLRSSEGSQFTKRTPESHSLSLAK